jgi:LysM repeat protein
MTTSGRRPRRKREFNSGIFTIAILGVVLIFLFSFMGWMLLHKNAQAVTVDDERVAYIKDVKMTTEDFNNLILAKLKEKTGNNVQLKETVTLVPAHVSNKKINKNTESVLTNLCNTLTYKQEAAAITVNGEEKAILATEEEAQSLLDQILAIYKTEDDPEIVEVSFVDDVQVVSEFVEQSEVMTTVKASDILRSYTTEPKVYTVKSGDSFSGIAAQADMTDDELLAANPSITKETMHKLQIGQEININVPVPVLSVKVVKEYKEEQDIEIPTTTVENSREYTTYQKVVSAGKKGKKEVVTHVTYVNGYEDSSEVVGENVIQEAQAQTVEVGTLKP